MKCAFVVSLAVPAPSVGAGLGESVDLPDLGAPTGVIATTAAVEIETLAGHADESAVGLVTFGHY